MNSLTPAELEALQEIGFELAKLSPLETRTLSAQHRLHVPSLIHKGFIYEEPPTKQRSASTLRLTDQGIALVQANPPLKGRLEHAAIQFAAAQFAISNGVKGQGLQHAIVDRDNAGTFLEAHGFSTSSVEVEKPPRDHLTSSFWHIVGPDVIFRSAKLNATITVRGHQIRDFIETNYPL